MYPRHLQLWNDFNLCWLALCQKQKDLTQDVVATGHQPSQTSLLSRDRMEAMGKELIQLCDQLEQHGLVDYQMGIWEEEILSGRWILLVLLVLFHETRLPYSTPFCFFLLYITTQIHSNTNVLLVLGQCLDLMESQPDLLRIQTVPEPATATQRP